MVDTTVNIPNNYLRSKFILPTAKGTNMSISITVTDPTNDEALRVADYLYDLAGYTKRIRDMTSSEASDALRAHVESLELPNPAYTPGSVAPPPPPANVELDSAGRPWDARIHASSKAQVADGTWRKRKNLDPAIAAALTVESSSHGGNPTVAIIDQIGATLPGGAWPFPPEVSGSVPPPPAPPAMTFAQFMPIVSAKIADKTLTVSQVMDNVRLLGLSTIPELATRPDLIPQLATALGIAV